MICQMKTTMGSSEDPPLIPPRTKKNKKGPALPEKPAHMKIPSSSVHSSQQPLKPTSGIQREVLIAASKSGRERPVDKRQREPAKLLVPKISELKNVSKSLVRLEEPSKKEIVTPWVDDMCHKQRSTPKGSRGLQEMLPSSKRELSLLMTQNPLWKHLDDSINKRHQNRTSNRPLQPILLVPRNLLGSWAQSTSNISYALWSAASQRDNRVIRQQTSGTSTVRLRSGNSVTRSGSLTSQGSNSGSDSETFLPKSALKKQRRGAKGAETAPSPAHRKVDQKKNVTFNAFATVQLMEE